MFNWIQKPFLVILILLTIQVLGAIDAVLSRYALVLGVDPLVFISIRIALCLPLFFIGSCIVTRQRAPESVELLESDSSRVGISLQEEDNRPATSLAYRIRHLTFNQHLAFIGLGLIGVTLFLPLRYYGNLMENASTTGIANAIVPIVTFIMTILCRHEVITWKKTIGVVISLGGAVVMFTPWELDLYLTIGLILLFCSSVCFGIFISLQKPFLDLFPPVFVLARVFGYGSIGIFLIAISRYQRFSTLFDLPVSFGSDGMWAWGAIMYSAWVNTVFGYILYGHAIHLASPLLTGLFVNIQPVLINVLAVLFLREVIPMWTGVGACLIMLGVIIVTVARYYHSREVNEDADVTAYKAKHLPATRYAYHYTSPIGIDGIDLDDDSDTKNCCQRICCMNTSIPIQTPVPAVDAGWHHSPNRPLGRLSSRNYVS